VPKAQQLLISAVRHKSALSNIESLTLVNIGDTVTTPTPAMLEAVSSCSLLDDVFQEDPVTNDLEAYVAERTGKEAGLFVLSGTMGNQLALRSLLTQPPYSVLCDYRAHIFTSEAGGLVFTYCRVIGFHD
jgi:threonine aldolase